MAQFSGEEKRGCTLCISKSQNIKGNSFVDMRLPAWAIWKLYIWGAWIKQGGSRQVCIFRLVAQLCHPAPGTDVKLLQPLSWMPSLTQETSFPRGLAVLCSHLPVINVGWQAKQDHAWARGSCMGFLWRHIPFPHSRQPCRISIYYRQTMSGGNASTMPQDVIICQLVPSP